MRVSVSDGKKILKTRHFVERCMKKNIFSPSEMSRIWNENFKQKKEPHVFTKAMRRLGISASDRVDLKHEADKKHELKDIEEYEEVKRYVAFSKGMSNITTKMIKRTLTDIRRLWDMMVAEGYPNPREWNLELLVNCLEKHIERDENGQWLQAAKVMGFLGAYNRTFEGILPKGWSTGLKREAGELKDYLKLEEVQEFLENIQDSKGYPAIMWSALYSIQVSGGFREGTTGRTGILSLRWENIDFERRRCSVREKGKKGHPARLWKNIPLDLFPFLRSWESLLEWHRTKFGYYPSATRHATGKVFPVRYIHYRDTFHETRKRCIGRISKDLETMKPHIFRKTHGQWLCNFGVPVEWICGQFPNGWYGVGWDDPKILLAYYIDLGLAENKRLEIIQKMHNRMVELELIEKPNASLTAWKNVAFGVNAPLAVR